ncbi:hypothetical protein ES703_101210 [subsurface metagenome]
MDYETFKNSAYLRQGHADEFTLKKATERKEVLADILGLSFYDELEEQAKNLAKQQETEKAQLESAIKDISHELAQKPAYEAEFKQAQGELSRIEVVIREQESKLNSLRRERDLLENKKQQLSQLQEHKGDIERNLERWDEQVKQHRSRLKEYEELIAQRSSIEQGYAQFAEVKKLNEELDKKFRLSTALNERKHSLEISIERQGQELVKAHAVTQSRIKELEVSLQKLPQLKNELRQVEAQLRQLTEPEERLHRKKQDNQQLQTRIHYLESSKAQLEKGIREIEEKLKLLLTQSNAKCPLCETELGTEGLKRIESKYTSDRRTNLDSLSQHEAELGQKKIELSSLEKEILQLETRLNQDRASAQSKACIPFFPKA